MSIKPKVTCCSGAAQHVHYKMLNPKEGAWFLQFDQERNQIYFCPFCSEPLPATGWEKEKYLIRLAFEMDGVLCKRTNVYKYRDAEPYPHSINVVNSLYERKNAQGKRLYRIVIQTSRYMEIYRSEVDECIESGFDEAAEWLQKHNVKHDELHFGKVASDICVGPSSCMVNGKRGMEHWEKNFYPLLNRIKTRNKARN